MKKLSLTLALINISFYILAQEPTLKTFYFLGGNWEMKTKTGKIIERWKKHKDSLTSTSYKFNTAEDIDDRQLYFNRGINAAIRILDSAFSEIEGGK